MNYHRLLYFLEIVEAGTYTSAANNLRIAQPALSRQMKNLENELGFALFQRDGNRMILSHAGRRFVPIARETFKKIKEAEQATLEIQRGTVEKLTLATTVTTIYEIVAPFLATLHTPAPMIVTRAESHFEIYSTLWRHADIGISPTPPIPGLHYRTVENIPIRAWVNREHPWAKQQLPAVEVSDLVDNHLIIPSHNSASRYVIDSALSNAKKTPRKVTECDNGATILALAGTGHGVGVSTELSSEYAIPISIRNNINNGSEILNIPLHIAWQHNHFAYATIEKIAIDIHKFINEKYKL